MWHFTLYSISFCTKQKGPRVGSSSESPPLSRQRGYLGWNTLEESCHLGVTPEDTMGLYGQHTLEAGSYISRASDIGNRYERFEICPKPKPRPCAFERKLRGREGRETLSSLPFTHNRVYQDMRKSPTGFWSSCVTTAVLKTFMLTLGIGILPFGQIINDMP